MGIYSSSIFDAALTSYDAAAEKVESIFDQFNQSIVGTGLSDKSEFLQKVDKLNPSYQYTNLLTKYDDALPKKATDVRITAPILKNVPLTNSYTATTVDDSTIQSTITPLNLGSESDLPQIDINDAEIAQIRAYVDQVIDVIQNLSNELDSVALNVPNLPFTNYIEVFYKSLWDSGFLAVLKQYNIVDGLEAECEKYGISISDPEFFDQNRELITSYLQTKVNNVGFSIPAVIWNTTQQVLEQTKDFQVKEIDRIIDLLSTKLTNELYANGITIEQFEKDFTKSVNNFSLTVGKTLLAAKEAELKARLDVNSAAISNIGKQLRAITNYFKIVDAAIQTEELNLSAQQELLKAWSIWTKATVAKENNSTQINKLYLEEFEGLLKEMKAKDEFKKLEAEGAIKTKELKVNELVTGKAFELLDNTSQLLVYKSKIAFAQSYLKRFRIELEAYLKDVESIYAEYEAKAGMLPAFGNISTEGGRLLGSLLNDSKIKLTTKKGTAS